MTFKDYLQTRRARSDARGDFSRLVKGHDDLPEPASWAELRTFMEARGTPRRVLEAERHVLADYQDVRAKRVPVG